MSRSLAQPHFFQDCNTEDDEDQDEENFSSLKIMKDLWMIFLKNFLPLKLQIHVSVNFAAGCRLYSILCECRLIPCNFVFNIRFIMHCTSPPLLNQLNFLLNLTYLALSVFSPELWKLCKYQQRPIVCWQNRKKWERFYLLTIVQFVMVDCDRHCVLWVGGRTLGFEGVTI